FAPATTPPTSPSVEPATSRSPSIVCVSSLSDADEQPGSDASTKPSPSLSRPSAHAATAGGGDEPPPPPGGGGGGGGPPPPPGGGGAGGAFQTSSTSDAD